MLYADYLKPDMVVLLRSETKEEAFAELVNLICRRNPSLRFGSLLNEVWEREKLVTTKVAAGIAIPHAKLTTLEEPIIAVGRSSQGIFYDTGDQDKVHLLVMIVSDNEKYLAILSSMAAKLNEEDTYRKIIEAKNTKEIYELLTKARADKAVHRPTKKILHDVFRHARELFQEVRAKALVIYADAVSDIRVLLRELDSQKVYLVTHSREKYEHLQDRDNVELVQVPFEGLSRAGQIELTHMFIAARGFLKKGDKVVSLYGKKGSGMFDTVMITDIEQEFLGYFMGPQVLPPDLRQEVFTRAVQLMNDLAREGREGKPTGTIFVLGDHNQVMRYCQQMVVNPFKGLREQERNILDPGLEETIKEFSKLDGAFIISGEGVIITAGAYLGTHTPEVQFLQGLGARHAAAASITSASLALAMVLSESTRKVSVFKSGKRIIVF
jgi:diadenylate cyclase